MTKLDRVFPDKTSEEVLDKYEEMVSTAQSDLVKAQRALDNARKGVDRALDRVTMVEENRERIEEVVSEWRELLRTGVGDDSEEYSKWDKYLKKLETAANKALMGWRKF